VKKNANLTQIKPKWLEEIAKIKNERKINKLDLYHFIKKVYPLKFYAKNASSEKKKKGLGKIKKNQERG
jgi:hypothetical protein